MRLKAAVAASKKGVQTWTEAGILQHHYKSLRIEGKVHEARTVLTLGSASETVLCLFGHYNGCRIVYSNLLKYICLCLGFSPQTPACVNIQHLLSLLTTRSVSITLLLLCAWPFCEHLWGSE